jgi:hypothetical protein
MAFKPNYRFERAERDRLKKARKEERLKRQQERVAVRRDDGPTEAPEREDTPTPDSALAEKLLPSAGRPKCP